MASEGSSAALNLSSEAYLKAASFNSTPSWLTLLPSTTRDLFLLPLRIAFAVETFIFMTLPRQFIHWLGLEATMEYIINNVTELVSSTTGGPDSVPATILTTVATVVSGSDVAAAEVVVEATGTNAGSMFGFGLGFGLDDIAQHLRKFGGLFSYLTTRWSLTCFAVAILLNRVSVYASTRRHLVLTWNRKLFLRILPILLYATQILKLLRAIRCQTSPDYSVFRYGEQGKLSSLDYAGEAGFAYTISSFLLSWEDEQASCNGASMAREIQGSGIPYGSFSLLWPVFLRVCLGSFVDTLSSALQGRRVATEGGMSIFEHSLAFAEAEIMISQSIGLGYFGVPQPNGASESATNGTSTAQIPSLSRYKVLERLNITPSLLIIALLSCCNSLTSSILDVFGKQSQYRLISTTFWGLCYMGCMLWGLLKGYLLGQENGLLDFPTVCIVGFLPHLILLIGTLTCYAIYYAALLLTAYSLPSDLPHPTSFRERLALAHGNMQGSTQIQNTRVYMHDDFYATLVRISYTALTAASEAVFLNEGKSVVVRRMTWLEEDRLAEIAAFKERRSNFDRDTTRSPVDVFQLDENFNFELPKRDGQWESGYAREKKLEKPTSGTRSVKKQSGMGTIGAFQGPARCLHGFTFFRAIFSLLLGWCAFGLLRLLERLGIPLRPTWLINLAGVVRKPNAPNTTDTHQMLDFWILTDEGVLELPENYEFDVEKEMRKREMMLSDKWDESHETQLDRKLYNWWVAGGSWGNQDSSEDYSAPEEDWDTTSIISTSTATETEWEDYESDGRQTPTQEHPYPESLVTGTLIDTVSLARLLDPKDKESKREARILASHLVADQENTIMTRSRFKQQMEMDRAKVLTSTRYIQSQLQFVSEASDAKNRKPTAREELELLEKLILSRRTTHSDQIHGSGASSNPQSWATGASGLGPDGPQCVICQASPRAIITWPCRCLCICEECRVSLAMNNFGSCVTCRREVTGFVRLWVP
ncbi:hypothetical protein FQN57_002560 [Myotisia sp. PD_48]|nr:hypothetical protein FQN57_002560 [Myotisia sp. PD_48]